MKRTQDCPSELRWDQWKLNSLSSSESQSLELHVQHCEWCQRRKQEREHSLQLLLDSPLFEELLEEKSRLSSDSSTSKSSLVEWWSRQWEWALGPALLASLALVFLTRPVVLPPVSPVAQEPARTAKGQALQQWRVLHYKKGKKHSKITQEGQRLRSGDLLQFEYKLKEPFHIMIFSVNERKHMEAFLPMHGSSSLLLSTGAGTLPPDSSLELDENLGKERIVLLYSKKHFDWKSLQVHLKKLMNRRQLRGVRVTEDVMALDLVTLHKIR
jgi:hypothetical protein